MTPTLRLGHEPVESPSDVRHVDEPFGLSSGRKLMSSRSEPNGLLVEPLKAEWRLRVIYERNSLLFSTFSFLEALLKIFTLIH
jgi:hypothetical protein